jgi:hypothetical protein
MPKLASLPLSLTTSLLIVALAGPAVAGSLYRWTAADGSVAFSDDVKRIPSQYRASAQQLRSGDLANYERYTPAETRSAQRERSAALAERIERLRAFNDAGSAEHAAASAPEGDTILRLDDRTSLTIPNDRAANAAPIVVEERRVRDRNNTTTTHVTVVRRGDQILSVVRPESAHDRADWPEERELYGDYEE